MEWNNIARQNLHINVVGLSSLLTFFYICYLYVVIVVVVFSKGIVRGMGVFNIAYIFRFERIDPLFICYSFLN